MTVFLKKVMIYTKTFNQMPIIQVVSKIVIGFHVFCTIRFDLKKIRGAWFDMADLYFWTNLASRIVRGTESLTSVFPGHFPFKKQRLYDNEWYGRLSRATIYQGCTFKPISLIHKLLYHIIPWGLKEIPVLFLFIPAIYIFHK
jgi:hypothetical protein